MKARLHHRPITLREANAFVGKAHRHLRGARGCRWALGAYLGDQLVGVVIVGRPHARATQKREPLTCEVIRLATDGTHNACSFLYGRARRVAQTMGYTRLLTKTLATEPGASLRAAGFCDDGLTRGGTWDRPSRRRVDKHPTGPKRRWVAELVA